MSQNESSGRTVGRPPLPESQRLVTQGITLYPHQWEWLKAQASGPSRYVRMMVDQAMKAESEELNERQAD